MAKKPQRTDADRRVRQCERLGRLLQVLQLIMSKGRWDADGLAAQLECSRRTVYRLLQTLSMAGVPWYFDDTCRAYRVRPGFKFPLIEMSSQPKKGSTSFNEELVQSVKLLIADGQKLTQSLKDFLVMLEAVETGPRQSEQGQ